SRALDDGDAVADLVHNVGASRGELFGWKDLMPVKDGLCVERPEGEQDKERPHGLSEWLVDRGALLAEELRTAFGHVEAVLQTHAEFAVDGDHRLIAEAHAGRERRLVAAH